MDAEVVEFVDTEEAGRWPVSISLLIGAATPLSRTATAT
jgi:hypothetical protein